MSVIWHYSDVRMGTIASQITSLTIVYSTVYSDADQRKHQSFASLAFVRGIHWRLVNSLHKWPVMWKMFPFDDVIMPYLTLTDELWAACEYCSIFGAIILPFITVCDMTWLRCSHEIHILLLCLRPITATDSWKLGWQQPDWKIVSQEEVSNLQVFLMILVTHIFLCDN